MTEIGLAMAAGAAGAAGWFAVLATAWWLFRSAETRRARFRAGQRARIRRFVR